MWPSLLSLLPSLLDKLLPDPGAAAAAKLELLRLVQTGELAALQAETTLAQGQNEVNKIEAASSSLFVAGWRPAVGWICAGSLGFKFIAAPLLVMFTTAQLPDIGANELIPLLLGMLGLGGLRTIEKVRGKA